MRKQHLEEQLADQQAQTDPVKLQAEIDRLKAENSTLAATIEELMTVIHGLKSDVAQLRKNGERKDAEILALKNHTADLRDAHDEHVKAVTDFHAAKVESIRDHHQKEVGGLHAAFLGELDGLRTSHKEISDQSAIVSKRLGRADAVIALQHAALEFYAESVGTLAKNKLDPQAVIANMNTLMIDAGKKADKSRQAAVEYNGNTITLTGKQALFVPPKN